VTTAEMPLTIRSASLRDLEAVLRHQHHNKLDAVVPARDIRMSDGHLLINGLGQPVITISGVTSAHGRFASTATCDSGLADKLGIPVQYLRRMRDERHLDLLDHNVNEWLSAADTDKRYLVRTFRGQNGEPGIARALMSDKYKINDNLNVLLAVLNGIRDAGVTVEVSHCDLTESRMYVKVVCPAISALAPRLLRNYTSPWNGRRGADNPVVFAGFVFSNSEVGRGALTITPRIVVEICDNGLTVERDLLRSVHVGARMDDGVVRWSRDTLDTMIALAGKQARDAVRTFLNHDYIAAKIDEIEAEAGIRVKDVEATLEHVANELRFTTDEQNTILNHFIDGGDRTSGGVLQAVTSAAQTLDDADRSYEIERHGLRAMRRAAAFQR
jgi:hypothetical protein